MKKLNDEDVYEIRKQLKDGVSGKRLAIKFEISEATISRIRRGVLHKSIVCPSEEFTRGYQEGYKKGFKDAGKFKTLEEAERPQFLATNLDLSNKSKDN